MRVMVIVSGDYGELGTAMYFLQGLRSAQVPLLLVPTPLRAAIDATTGVEVRTFAGLADIARLVDEARPDTVLLASGYLLAINSVLPFADAVRLIRMLSCRGRTLLTSDPFLGALPRPWEFDFRSLAERRGRRAGLAAALVRRAFYGATGLLMFGHLAVLGSQLRRAWHVYPVPVLEMRARPGVKRVCYFSAPPQRTVPPRPRPEWLFVLSKVDFQMQGGKDPADFIAQVARRLLEAAALGRGVLVIGPEDMVTALRPYAVAEPRIAIHSDTSYAAYMERLLAAEYVFFWNYYSFSVLHRVIANLPVLFFDPGHLEHFLPVFAQEGIRICYDGWRPPLLPLDAPLDERDLARRAQESVDQFQRVSAGLRRCPSPQDLLDSTAAPARSR